MDRTTSRRPRDGSVEPAGSTVRNSVTTSVWTLVSRVTGLLRVVVIGAVLGPTFLANVFLATNTVPVIVFSAVAGPVLALVVVPVIVHTALERGHAESEGLLRKISAVLLLASAAVATALALLSPVVAWTLTLGVPEAERERALRLTVLMVLFVAPQVVLYTIAALAAAAQQARGRFALAAAAPAAENVGLMVTMLAVEFTFSDDAAAADVGNVPITMVVILGVGATMAVLLHAVIQVAGAARVGMSLRPERGWRADEQARRTVGRLRSSVAVAGFPSAGFYALLGVSATVPGGVLVLQMAHAVYGVCAALGARAITAAALPGLSAAAAADRRPQFARAWREAMALAVIAGLPLLCLMIVLAEPAARLLSHGQLSTGLLVAALTGCITVLGAAQLAAGVHEIGRQALFARMDVRGPRIAGARAFGVTVVAAAGTVLLPAGVLRMVAVAAVLLLSDLTAAVTVVGRLRSALSPERLLDRSRAAAALAAATAMVPPLVVAVWFAGHNEAGPMGDLVVLVPLVAVAAAVYAGVLLVLERRIAAHRRHRPAEAGAT